MSEEAELLSFLSSRFGTLEVPVESIIEFPSGIIGFSKYTRYVMLDYHAPFSWLHSVEEPTLAFVVIDGFSLGTEYDQDSAFRDSHCAYKAGDEYAILLIVTIREDRQHTVNTTAPLFVNVMDRKGVQAIFDAPGYSTRWPLWTAESQSDDHAVAEPVEGKEQIEDQKDTEAGEQENEKLE